MLTKAHNQSMPALSLISRSLHKYGHNNVNLVYTDNVHGDKAELENAFPSLHKDVLPVPSSSLQAISIPDKWQSHILGTTFQVNSCLDVVMENLALKAPDDHIHVAIDNLTWSGWLIVLVVFKAKWPLFSLPMGHVYILFQLVK